VHVRIRSLILCLTGLSRLLRFGNRPAPVAPAPQVHRGVYEAAQYLYRRFLPLVYEAIDSSPCTKICFTVRVVL